MDVLRAAEAVQAAKRQRIHIFIATSALHMKYKLRMEPDEVLQPVSTPSRWRVSTPTTWNGRPRTAPAPTSTSCAAASRPRSSAGATTINLPDTVGYALPEDMERIFTMVRNRVPGADKVVLSTHNHNDLGLAVANTLAAIRAGVRQVEATINGIGERAGNASLEEAVMAIRTRQDAMPLKNNINTPEPPAGVEAAGDHHRLRRAAEQGDRRPQRLRA